MPPKKKKGERADGRFQVSKTINGEKKFFYGETLAAAKKKRDEYINDLADRPQNYRDITLAEWLTEWLNTVKKDNVRGKTWESYESNARVHIIPHIGNHKLTDLDTPTIRKFLTERKNAVVCRRKKPTPDQLKTAKKIKPRTLQYIYVTLNAALEQARKDKIIKENPCEPIEKPKAEKPPIKPFTENEKNALLEVVKNDLMFCTLLTLAFDTGARSSELLNLKWDNVDLKAGRIVIAEASEQTKEGPREGKPKSETSFRSIKLTKGSLNLLIKYQLHQENRIAEYGIKYKNRKLVFSKENGDLIPNYELSKNFKDWVTEAGVRPDAHFHEIRHTFLTELARMGVNPLLIKQIGGHADFNTTMIYVHLGTEEQNEVIKKLDKKRSSQKAVN